MRSPVVVEQDVGWLQVTVNDAPLVSVMDGSRRLGDELGRLTGGRPTVGRALGQAAARDVFHAEKGLPLMFAYFVDRHNAWMVEAGGRFRFLSEAPHIFQGREPAGQNHLQRDEAVEWDVSSLVHDAHAASAQLFQDLVAGNLDLGRGPLQRPRCIGWRRKNGRWFGRVCFQNTWRPFRLRHGHDAPG